MPDNQRQHRTSHAPDVLPLRDYLSLSLSRSPPLSLAGPINTLWMEHLNTVLDETKMLTIANGDRMPLAEGNKVIEHQPVVSD